jgi:hypothetical protein
LETRWLHALPREEAVDRFPVNAEDAADAHRIQSPVMDQPSDRLRVHTELIRNLANADEPGSFAWYRHDGGPSLARSSISRFRRPNWGSRRVDATGRWARFAPNGSS